MTETLRAARRPALRHTLRSFIALAGVAIVIAAIANASRPTEPVVLAAHVDAPHGAPTTAPPHSRSANVVTATPTATTPSTTTSAVTTTTAWVAPDAHATQPWDYAIVVPDLSPMITIPADLAPAAPDLVMNAIMAGWPPELRDTALAVAECESRLDSIAVHANANFSTDYGLFQLNGGIGGQGSTLAGLGGTPTLALDVTWNAAAAYRLFTQRGWEPWQCAGRLHLLLVPPDPGRYPLPPFADAPTTTTAPVDTEPPPGQVGQ